MAKGQGSRKRRRVTSPGAVIRVIKLVSLIAIFLPETNHQRLVDAFRVHCARSDGKQIVAEPVVQDAANVRPLGHGLPRFT